jgi:hypothetical protein
MRIFSVGGKNCAPSRPLATRLQAPLHDADRGSLQSRKRFLSSEQKTKEKAENGKK